MIIYLVKPILALRCSALTISSSSSQSPVPAPSRLSVRLNPGSELGVSDP